MSQQEENLENQAPKKRKKRSDAGKPRKAKIKPVKNVEVQEEAPAKKPQVPARIRRYAEMPANAEGCGCGCGETPKGKNTFLPGHDARLKGKCLAVSRHGLLADIIPAHMTEFVLGWHHLGDEDKETLARELGQ